MGKPIWICDFCQTGHEVDIFFYAPLPTLPPPSGWVITPGDLVCCTKCLYEKNSKLDDPDFFSPFQEDEILLLTEMYLKEYNDGRCKFKRQITVANAVNISQIPFIGWAIVEPLEGHFTGKTVLALPKHLKRL